MYKKGPGVHYMCMPSLSCFERLAMQLFICILF